MERLVKDHKDVNGGPLGQAMRQAARELLLLQSSDWPFLVTTGQAKQYAIERFKSHHQRFQQLVGMVLSGDVDKQRLHEIEDTDNCFPDIDPRAWDLSAK